MPHIGCRSILSNGLVLALSFAAWGCTAIGYAIGAASDESAMKVFRPLDGTVSPFKPGQQVRVVLADGSVLKGTYQGIQAPEEPAADSLPGTPLPPPSVSATPVGSVLRLEERGKSDTQYVPLERVALIEHKPRTARRTGLIVGAAIDLGSLIAAAASRYP